MQEPIILHENSPRFPLQLLERFLGHMYVISSTDVDASVYGSPVRRERKLTRLYHKGKTNVANVPFSRFSARFERTCTMCWREFFFQHTLPDGGEQDFTQILYIYGHFECRFGVFCAINIFGRYAIDQCSIVK